MQDRSCHWCTFGWAMPGDGPRLDGERGVMDTAALLDDIFG